jgi:hypothetical protein
MKEKGTGEVMEHIKESRAAIEGEDLFADTPVGIVRSMQAYLRELPELLANGSYNRWTVAYCRDTRIALSPSYQDVVLECVRRGIAEEEYYIGIVTPQDPEEWSGLSLH